jgi:ATP-dependent Clp protease ATP-binding subunit ClpA
VRLAALKALKDKPNGILFIDEIHNFDRCWSASGGTLDASNLLEGASSGRSSALAPMTLPSTGILRKMRAQPPLPESRCGGTHRAGNGGHPEGSEISFRRTPRREVPRWPLAGCSRAQCQVHINDRHLPDKAIDVIDDAAGAAQRISTSVRKKTTTKTEASRDRGPRSQ